jgi:hypothetical protein
MIFQPNRGSSLYKRLAENKILPNQKEWNSPVGTLRLSDHWNYNNRRYDELVYRTSTEIPLRTWVLCINTNIKPNAWKVLEIFETKKSNVIRKINFKKIQSEIDSLL